MTVTECLQRAHDCAAMSGQFTGEEKQRLLELAEAWLRLAENEAEVASRGYGKTPEHRMPK